MKQSLNEIIGYTIEAKDGEKGKVKDILFDEERWVVRYLDVDLANFPEDNRVLIPKMFLKKPLWSIEHFPVELTIKDIYNCPSLSKKLPISRKYEEKLNRYYKSDDYWSKVFIPFVGAPGVTYPIRPTRIPTKVIDEKKVASKLRSFKEFNGYHIHAIDGKLGHIDDVIIEDDYWQIIYVSIDTSNWLPWSKRVLVGVEWMEEISYANKEIKINLDIETIKSAPEFHPSEDIDKEFEAKLNMHYNAVIK